MLYFFFPKDYAYAAADSATDFSNRVSLRRYFYSDRSKDYMLVCAPWNWINSAPVGDLIIDPTTNAAMSVDVRLYDASKTMETIPSWRWGNLSVRMTRREG